ncbi:MAG: hypothetical protein Q7Q71_15725 [Verrucomicrobiota bacterium JB023]|nr:hypothetical protein [Verrucomicrobiota bacterium JB023]
MRTTLTLISLVVFTQNASLGAITIPGADGSSGVLNITEDTTIDLSLAATGQWDAANSASGIYDAEKWAVVFNYSTVTIAEGATLTFTNHPSKAPVVWLVNGDVTIDGTVALDGQDHQLAPLVAEGGPGGFRGAAGSFSGTPRASAGFGPGGGFRQGDAGTSGSYGTAVSNSPTYGNPSLIPLLGGSGGAGDPESGRGRGGGAGGGALLIAAAQGITINGELRANGGAGIDTGYSSYNDTGGGSGGGLRLVCDSLAGSGALTALGGSGWQSGGLGRIRVERVANNSTLSLTPDPSVVPLSSGDTAVLWPPATAPEVEILSIGGETAPADPRASFGAEGADVSLGETTTTPIVIQTTNVEQASTVQVRITPRSDANATIIDASVDTVVSTDPLVIQWTAELPVNTGYSAIQVKVVRP